MYAAGSRIYQFRRPNILGIWKLLFRPIKPTRGAKFMSIVVTRSVCGRSKPGRGVGCRQGGRFMLNIDHCFLLGTVRCILQVNLRGNLQQLHRGYLGNLQTKIWFLNFILVEVPVFWNLLPVLSRYKGTSYLILVSRNLDNLLLVSRLEVPKCTSI